MKKHWIFTSLVVLGALFLLLTTPTHSETEPENSFKSKDILYKVLGIDETNNIDGPISEIITENKFVIVTVTATNENKEPIQLSSDMFTLIDNKKREYEVHTKGNFFLNRETGFFMHELSPGLSKQGVLAFEVPENAEDFKLRVRTKSTFKDVVKEISLDKKQGL